MRYSQRLLDMTKSINEEINEIDKKSTGTKPNYISMRLSYAFKILGLIVIYIIMFAIYSNIYSATVM